MILTCPACSTRYRTDPDNFRPEGRRVRCSVCGDVWFQTPPPDVDAMVEAESPTRLLAAPAGHESAATVQHQTVAEPVWRKRGKTAYTATSTDGSGKIHPGLDRFKVSRPRGPSHMRGAAGWLVLVALILVPLGGMYLFRTGIVNAWPKTARVYSALGIPVTPGGLLIHAEYGAVHRDGRPLIEVRGEIENQGSEARPVPPLQLAIYDGDRRELYRWVVPVNRAPLDPRGRRAFRTSFPAPGKDVKVHIQFAEGE